MVWALWLSSWVISYFVWHLAVITRPGGGPSWKPYKRIERIVQLVVHLQVHVWFHSLSTLQKPLVTLNWLPRHRAQFKIASNCEISRTFYHKRNEKSFATNLKRPGSGCSWGGHHCHVCLLGTKRNKPGRAMHDIHGEISSDLYRLFVCDIEK